MEDRKEVLLKAAFDILTKCHESFYVVDAMGETAFYDGTDCDGMCLLEDIAHELGIEDFRLNK